MYVKPAMHVFPLGCGLLATSGMADECAATPELVLGENSYRWFFRFNSNAIRASETESLCANPQLMADRRLVSEDQIDWVYPVASVNPYGLTLRDLINYGTPRPDIECRYDYVPPSGSDGGYTYYYLDMVICYNGIFYQVQFSDQSW